VEETNGKGQEEELDNIVNRKSYNFKRDIGIPSPKSGLEAGEAAREGRTESSGKGGKRGCD